MSAWKGAMRRRMIQSLLTWCFQVRMEGCNEEEDDTSLLTWCFQVRMEGCNEEGDAVRRWEITNNGQIKVNLP